MDHRDWDNGLKELLAASRRIRPKSKIGADSQEYMNEMLDALHGGAPGGMFIRLPNGGVQYIFMGGDGGDPHVVGLEAIIEILRALVRKAS